MEWDIGLRGLATLMAMSLGFGLFAQLLDGRAVDLSLLIPAFLFCLLVGPFARVLMVKVYEHTESVLIAAMMHASLTGVVAMSLIPLDAKSWPLAAWYLVFGIALAGATTLIREQSPTPAISLNETLYPHVARARVPIM